MDTLTRAMPVEGFIGRLMIGFAAALMLLGAGRIAGVGAPAKSVLSGMRRRFGESA